MFVKVYHYHIRPGKTGEFLDIQERTGRIYQKHVAYRAVHLQKLDDPHQWLEIHWYPNEAVYRRSMDLINSEPEIKQLWQEFQALLHPEDKTISEEYYNQIRSEDSLTQE
jgi:hypothetical protein